MKIRCISLLALLVIGAMSVYAQWHAKGPTMGWSSWNTFQLKISDTIICRQADIMVEKGFAKHGYKYINIDDGFFGGRDKATGKLLIHPKRFPNGLKPVADHIHKLGLKAGIYSDAGANTCGNYWGGDTIGHGVGLYMHEEQDLNMYFTEYGFDFIKVDFCGGTSGNNFDRLNLDPRERYTLIHNIISEQSKKLGREIRFNVCRWDYPGAWITDIATSWRMSGDIQTKWFFCDRIIKESRYLSAYAHDGCYNDMDMLEVGCGYTPDEDDTHFALWCIMSSPLLIGCDVSKLDQRTYELLTNDELIAVDQDPLCLQAYMVKQPDGIFVFVKDVEKLHGKTRVLAVHNNSDKEKSITLNLNEIDLVGKAKVRNLLTRADESDWDEATPRTFTLRPHATHIVKLTAAKRLERKVYEAETAFLTAYQELTNPLTTCSPIYRDGAEWSGGARVENLGSKEDNDLVWKNVKIFKGGQRTIKIIYGLPISIAKPLSYTISVDGKELQTIKVAPGDTETSITLNLPKGIHDIRLSNTYGPMPPIDAMILD